MREFPLGRRVILDELAQDPHPILARLRVAEPVSWIPARGGWLITRYDLAVHVLRNPATFTVDDRRFSTSQVIGASMLSLDGADHARHRAPFAHPFHPTRVRNRFTALVEATTDRLIAAMRPGGGADLRREFAGPLAADVITHVVGLRDVSAESVLAWYDTIAGAVSGVTAGGPVAAAGAQAFSHVRTAVVRSLDRYDRPSLLTQAAQARLSRPEIISNAAVLLFGGMETTEGMIANAARYLLGDPDTLTLVRDRGDLVPNAIEESMRMEPAAAIVDRYATRDVELAGVQIQRGDLVSVSITAANRDPAVFTNPDRFDVRRPNARLHLAFAYGPHFCLGAQLARTETVIAMSRLLERLPGLRLDPDCACMPQGLVFRKPQALPVRWTA
ncbi:cytochrome P450 [Mycobacterium botniense]|uniref:cytochrome P450 n=1 Tax=Mycobacterium botniense TaxID=84962 RepID=UPI001FE41DEC|nr:cytochrome P450 [Mycobacterium botniense]